MLGKILIGVTMSLLNQGQKQKRNPYKELEFNRGTPKDVKKSFDYYLVSCLTKC